MWTSFAALTAGVASGLTGLTFIVVAFRLDTIAGLEEYRNRAAQTLSLFLTTAVLAVLLTAPQPLQAIGVEMVAIAAVVAIVLVSTDRAARRQQNRRTNVSLTVFLVIFIVGITVCGLFLILGLAMGLYFFVVSSLTALVLGVNGTWALLTLAGKPSTTSLEA